MRFLVLLIPVTIVFELDVSLLQSRKSVKLMREFNRIEDPKLASALVELVSAMADGKKVL